MAEIIENPIEEIFARFKQKLVSGGLITASNISFGKSDVGAILPWISFKPMTNYTWSQAVDLSNNENGIIVNIQIECFARKESTALQLEDECKTALFSLGFQSNGFNQRFKDNEVHRYISRYALRYTGEVIDLDSN